MGKCSCSQTLLRHLFGINNYPEHITEITFSFWNELRWNCRAAIFQSRNNVHTKMSLSDWSLPSIFLEWFLNLFPFVFSQFVNHIASFWNRTFFRIASWKPRLSQKALRIGFGTSCWWLCLLLSICLIGCIDYICINSSVVCSVQLAKVKSALQSAHCFRI